MTSTNQVKIAEELIADKIYIIRGVRVMLDRDLADLYGVETKNLKRQVKRNIDRFPKDFMFEMSKKDFENWRSQFGTSNNDKMGLRYAPYCFTEYGVLMLSSVINSKRAIEVNIQIMRIFAKLREILLDSTTLKLEIEVIKKTLDKHNKSFEIIADYLDGLSEKVDEIEKKQKHDSRVRIGFKKSK